MFLLEGNSRVALNTILESVEALQNIVDKMDGNSSDNLYAIRGVLTDLLPLGPLVEWEIEYGNENRSTAEEVVGWMEGICFVPQMFFKSLFIYPMNSSLFLWLYLNF